MNPPEVEVSKEPLHQGESAPFRPWLYYRRPGWYDPNPDGLPVHELFWCAVPTPHRHNLRDSTPSPSSSPPREGERRVFLGLSIPLGTEIRGMGTQMSVAHQMEEDPLRWAVPALRLFRSQEE
jgi:hypothetical protein